jgi:TRAP-type C4-dicarboxylate transport system permease small subunit
VDALLAALHGVARRGLVIAADLVNLAFMLVLLWQGVNMMVLTSDTTSTAMGLNMGVVYASLPAGAAVSCLYIILRLIAGFRGSEIESQTLLMD